MSSRQYTEYREEPLGERPEFAYLPDFRRLGGSFHCPITVRRLGSPNSRNDYLSGRSRGLVPSPRGHASSAKISLAAFTVSAMSFSVWHAETKLASNWLHGR